MAVFFMFCAGMFVALIGYSAVEIIKEKLRNPKKTVREILREI